MMRLHFIWLLLLLSFPVKAQYIFNPILPKNGLSTKAITSVFKDEEGFVWLGTANGLNRYDGSAVAVYNPSNNNYNHVPDAYIHSVTGYGRGKIWLGTGKGLACFDKLTDSFTSVPVTDTGNHPQNNITVVKLIVAGNRLWVATYNGFYVLQNKKAVPVSTLFPKASSLNKLVCIAAACMADEKRKGIWIGSATGLYFLNYETGIVLSHENNPQQALLFSNDPTYSIAQEASNNIWISNKSHPLALYNFSTNSFSDIPYFDEDYKWKITAGNGSMFYDSYGRLWISSEYTKIFVLQPGNRFSILPDQSPPEYKLGYGAFTSVYEDKERNIWIATPNGVFKSASTNPLSNIIRFPGGLPKPFVEDIDINGLIKHSDGKWWLCKDDGLYLYDEETGKLERFALPDTVRVHSRFFNIALIDGEWWCCTRDGIQILNPVTKKFRPFAYYIKGHEVRKRSAFWVHKDRHGFIWYAAWGDAVYRFDPRTKQSIRFDGSDKKQGDIGAGNSLCVTETADGRIWIGYKEKGVRVFDYKTSRFSNPVSKQNSPVNFDSLIVPDLFEDKDHNVLLATRSEGILKITPKGICTKFITVENGLPANETNNIFIDKNNIAWTAFDGNIYYLKPGSKNVSVIRINIDVPLLNAWSCIQSDNNNLYVTIVNRLAVIDLSKVKAALPETKTLISRISVFEKGIPFSSLYPALQLRYDQNFFTVDFSSPSGNEHSPAQYAYKLDKFDKDWVYCGTRQTASYTNVPDGNYTFLVKSTKEDGEWSTAVTEVKINVEAPFYKTWWFVLLVLSALSLLFREVWLLRNRRRQKKAIDVTIDYFANSVYGENSITEICWDIARNCISQLALEDCVVYLIDDERGVLVQKAAYGPKNPKGHEIFNPLEIEVGRGIVGTVAATGKPLLIRDTQKDSRYIVDDENRASELAVPILHEGRLMGVIDSEHSKKNFFTPSHQKALMTIASISSNKIAEAKAEALAKENEIRLLEINKLLAESQLMALRTQMNPHFVFNCLNSIQECIVTEKYNEAIVYLNKFSKLFRSILNNSGKVLVTLGEEIEVLELYLVLEHMRFEKKFRYEITVNKDLDTDEIELPSMLLQPYVENALWHGLMHKEGDKKLAIEFESIGEDTFRCIIDDNGIGRRQSFKLKEGQSKTKRHQSMGMNITKDRIDLLKRQGNHASLIIVDKEENGEAMGTTVVIELSAYLK